MYRLCAHVEVCYFRDEHIWSFVSVLNLIARLPPLRSINRNLLLVILTVLLWTLDMIWQLLVDPFYPWQTPGSLHKQIESNIVVHLLFLPVLVLCYFAAMQIPR